MQIKDLWHHLYLYRLKVFLRDALRMNSDSPACISFLFGYSVLILISLKNFARTFFFMEMHCLLETTFIFKVECIACNTCELCRMGFVYIVSAENGDIFV